VRVQFKDEKIKNTPVLSVLEYTKLTKIFKKSKKDVF
jgi:hypothetical protein